MRAAVLATTVTLAIGLAAASDADAAIKRYINVPAQSLGPALRSLAKQRNFQIIYASQDVADLRSPGAVGEFTADQALEQLLGGTGFTYRYLDERTVTILPLTSGGRAGAAGSEKRPASADSSTSVETRDERTERRQSFWDRFRLAQVAEGQVAGRGAVAGSEGAPESTRIEEIIVTARKRAERLQDIPMSIAVIGNQDLERRGAAGMQDYLRSIPSVSQIDNGALSNAIVIRGITTSPQFENFAAGTTVATYFGETPITAAGGLGTGGIDVRPVDIERIEVLRGPQGTTYGSASLSGALRIIPNQPQLDSFALRLGGDWSTTSGAGSSNTTLQAVANVPVVPDVFGLRLVGYRYDESGFQRNIVGVDPASLAIANQVGQLGSVAGYRQDDVGRMISEGARLAARWVASDRLSLDFNVMRQTIEQDGAPVTTLGPYEQARFPVAPQGRVRGERGEVADTDIDLASAVLNYDFGWAVLTSAASWVNGGSLFAETVNFSNTASTTAPSDFRSFTVETRLASQTDGRLQYLAGVFYEDLSSDILQTLWWPGPDNTNPYGTNPGYIYEEERELDQRAVFGEVSYEITPKLTATAGARLFEYRKDERLLAEGGVYGVAFGAGTASTLASEQSDSSYRLSVKYAATEHSQLYASWSDGFRLGRPTAGLPPVLCDVNPADGIVDGMRITIESTRMIDSDFVDNYEIGGKFELLDRRVSLDAALYYIDWTGLPMRVRAPGCARSFTTNIGEAVSKGAEVQVGWLPTPGLRLDFGGSYTSAELTQNVPQLNPIPAFDGDRLPGSPKFSANFSAQYETTIAGYESFFRADSMYVGEFYGDLQQSPGLRAGGYAKVDARAGISLKNIDVELFVRNLTNEDAFTWRTIQAGTTVAYQLRPRTFGIHLGYRFE